MDKLRRCACITLLLAVAHNISAQTYPFFPPPGVTYDATNHTITSNEPVGILKPGFSVNGDSTSAPIYELIDNASAANNKRWWWLASGVLGMYAVDDAGNPGQSGIQLNRSGTNITQSALLAGSKILGVKSTGDVLVNGSVGLSGQPVLSGGVGANGAYGALNLANTNAVTGILPQANILSCAANRVWFDNTGGTAPICSAKFTWTDATATMNLSSSNALDATLVGGNVANKITMGFNDGTHLFAGAIDMVLDHGDIFVTGSNNPILLVQNTVANPAGFNGFQFANEIGDGLNFGNQPSTATSCSYLAGTIYPLTPATGCSLIDSGSQNTNPLPLVLGVNGHTAVVLQNSQGLFAVGTTPKQWAGWIISGTAITVTLGDNVTAGSITNMVGGSSANTRINGSQACSNATGCPATSTALTGTTGSIGGALLAAGGCSSGTVGITGATTAMAVTASPAAGTNPDPGSLGVYWRSRVSSANTITVDVCTPLAGTPTADTYNVRVLQ